MKGHRSAFPIKAVLLAAVSCVMLAALLYLAYLFKGLSLFRIKYVIGRPDSQVDLSYLKGSNIFELDLKKESKRLAASYPGYKNIKLVRVFPDRIFADFKERRPIAYLKLYRYFCVDDELVLFDMPKELSGPGLPIILGLERKIYSPSPGTRLSIKELALAAEIIETAGKTEALKDYPIKTIQVPSLNNASFVISGGLEIKISQEDVPEKLSMLGSLLNQERDGLGKIHYIDLRFKEPVIKLKDAD